MVHVVLSVIQSRGLAYVVLVVMHFLQSASTWFRSMSKGGMCTQAKHHMQSQSAMLI